MLTIDEYAKKYDVKVNTLRYWMKSGKIQPRFVHQEKSQNHRKYLDDIPPDIITLEVEEKAENKPPSKRGRPKESAQSNDDRKSHEELKRLKTEAEVAKLNLQNQTYVAQLFREWSEHQLEAFYEAFAIFKLELKKTHLSQKQANDINRIFEKCGETYSKNLLKKISEALSATF